MARSRLRPPRDRQSTFEPQIVGKHQRRIEGFDEKILALYAKGMTTRDIQEIVKELYGVDVSPDLISRVTEDLDAELKAWQSRTLPSVFPIVFFDGIVVHVRGADAKVSPHTVYVALGIDLEGKKELLGLWIAKTEGAKFWLGCLTDLRNRGLEDIFICCVDGLAGFPEAIRTAYPQARVQLCLVHLVRAALRYVATKDAKAVAADLKKIYTSPTVAVGRRTTRGICQSLGREVSDDFKAMAEQMDGHHFDVRLPRGDPPSDVHDQRDRVAQ